MRSKKKELKTAFISGVTGQDGAYLAELLLSKKYKVYGLIRKETSNFAGLEYLKIKNYIEFINCDFLNLSSVLEIIKKYNPDEIYNLAAQSSVYQSFKDPINTFQFNTISVFNFLESIKSVDKKIKFYQASSSEMFGRVENLPITESSLIHPLSPYAISKVAAHHACVNYRENYNLFICCGILFNHESYLRNNDFFVKKVICESIKISKKIIPNLQVGNIDIKRDFGFAPKYVEAMYLMLQQNSPTDFLICSGKSISLREIIYYVFKKLNLDENLCVINEAFYRPADILDIYGNNEKAKKELSWNYNYDFFDVLDLLIEEELKNYE